MAQKIDSLTGLRGVAALLVLAGHTLAAFPVGALPGRLAYLGMSLFFVLSGFVIYYNYAAALARREGVRPFLVARFARLYPLYALMTLIYFVPMRDVSWQMILAHLTLTQSWYPVALIYGPAWSVSTEWFFYLVFIAVAPAIAAVLRPRMVLLGALVAAPFLLGALFLLRDLLPAGDAYPWFTYYSPYARLFEFVAGAFAARVFVAGNLGGSAVYALIGAAWCAAILAFGCDGWLAAFQTNFIYAPAIVAIMLFACRENWLQRALSTGPALLIGEASYSLYMLQQPMHGVLTTYVTTDPVAHAALFVVLTILLSFVTYAYIEKPSRVYLRRVLSARAVAA